nr:hypothetical protein [Nostoc sp. DedQUE03]MDZ7971650.1 hypothetical protein [Nostoc sp. DedQUE03]
MRTPNQQMRTLNQQMRSPNQQMRSPNQLDEGRLRDRISYPKNTV